MFVGPPATSIKHIYHLTQMIDLNQKKLNRNVMVFNLDLANVLYEYSCRTWMEGILKPLLEMTCLQWSTKKDLAQVYQTNNWSSL